MPGEARSIERSTLDLREKRLLPVDEPDVARVEVTTPALSYTLARDGSAWRLDSPPGGKADEGTASRVVAAARLLRALQFLPGGGDPGRALERPAWRVRVVDAKGAAHAVSIAQGTAAGKASEPRPLYARADGASEIARLADGAQKDLEQTASSLQDKTAPDAGSVTRP